MEVQGAWAPASDDAFAALHQCLGRTSCRVCGLAFLLGEQGQRLGFQGLGFRASGFKV